MRKKSTLLVVLSVVMFVFAFTSQSFACHARAVGFYKDAYDVVHGFYCNLQSTITYVEIEISGADHVYARGINDEGYVVGEYIDSSVTHGFLYNMSTESYTTIDYPNMSYTRCWGVNDSNHIVGEYQDAGGDNHGFYYNGTTFTTIDYPDADFTRLHDINNSGTKVGRWDNVNDTIYGFHYDGNYFFTVLLSVAGSCSTIAINDNDNTVPEVAGWYIDSSDSNQYGYIYDGSTFTTMQPFSSTLSSVNGINDDLDAVGHYKNGSNMICAYYYDGSSYTLLEPYTSQIMTYALDISNIVYPLPEE